VSEVVESDDGGTQVRISVASVSDFAKSLGMPVSREQA